MTYAISIDVAVSVQFYDAFHTELVKHTGGRIEGLLAHVAWPTPTGIRIIEVWTSKELRDQASEEVIPPVWSTFMASTPHRPESVQEQIEELDMRGLVIPSAGLAA